MASPIVPMPPTPAPLPAPNLLGGPARQPPRPARPPFHGGAALDQGYAAQLARRQAQQKKNAMGYQGFRAPAAPRPNMGGTGPTRIPTAPLGTPQEQAAAMAQRRGLMSMAPPTAAPPMTGGL